jgi:hypothetical protein
MGNPCVIKQFHESVITQTSLQSNLDVILTLLSIIPRAWEPSKAQICKPTLINHLSESIHLPFFPFITAKLL